MNRGPTPEGFMKLWAGIAIVGGLIFLPFFMMMDRMFF